jgi:predicted small metal-binding protein
MKTHPHCNWDVFASGSAADVRAVNQVVDHIRAEHPHVTAYA